MRLEGVEVQVVHDAIHAKRIRDDVRRQAT